MGITERYFQLGTEHNVIHLPYRPNGFGIFILGDRTHFVGNHSSFWLQHYGRNQLLNMLRNEGYTLLTAICSEGIGVRKKRSPMPNS